MADNTTLPGTGDVVRDKDRAGVKTQIIGIDLAPGGAETLMNGAMPVTDNAGSLTVDSPGLPTALGSAVSANSTPVVIASDQAAVAVKLSQVAGTNVTVGSGVLGAGTQRVVLATDQPVIPATPTPSTTGGWTPSSQTALTNTKVAVKASAGNMGGWDFYNPNTSVAYIQVFDVASASVTLGTTAPTYVIPLPAGAGANVEWTCGINHATAITVAATTTPTGLTAMATALTGFFLFK